MYFYSLCTRATARSSDFTTNAVRRGESRTAGGGGACVALSRRSCPCAARQHFAINAYTPHTYPHCDASSSSAFEIVQIVEWAPMGVDIEMRRSAAADGRSRAGPGGLAARQGRGQRARPNHRFGTPHLMQHVLVQFNDVAVDGFENGCPGSRAGDPLLTGQMRTGHPFL